MLVIEGFHGKSLEVCKMVEEMDNDKVIIIEHDDYILSRMVEKPIRAYGMSEFYAHDKIERLINHAKVNLNFTHAILYLNAHPQHVDQIKQLERKCGINVILTVQVHASESQNPIKKYIV